MIKNLIQLYSIAICCVSAIILLVTLALTIQDITDLTLTEYKYRPNLIKFSSVEKFISSNHEQERVGLKLLSKNDINNRMEFEKNLYITERQDHAIANLINKASWIVISIIFWSTHLIMYKRDNR
ncbi:hypothetical protein [Candidatus Tisiphia endosymbiont of Neophilaenus lineatus]|uniref:hypothetical protein n=1 Tax=Candidatus Tisiphia endosymbiont of Neophilaenus lineatus TaxID=3139336 RepID=UPI0035CC0D05